MTTLNRNAVMLALAGVALAACAPLAPRLDASFGDAVNIAKARQVIDKDAPTKNAAKDAAGLDGQAAKAVIDRYEKSFVTPEPQPNVFAIGVSGSSSGGPR